MFFPIPPEKRMPEFRMRHAPRVAFEAKEALEIVRGLISMVRAKGGPEVVLR